MAPGTNGRLRDMVKRGDAVKHRRVAPKKSRDASAGQFRTFKLTKGTRIEKAVRRVH